MKKFVISKLEIDTPYTEYVYLSEPTDTTKLKRFSSRDTAIDFLLESGVSKVELSDYRFTEVSFCRVCGCCDVLACESRCYWVENTLCSNCRK